MDAAAGAMDGLMRTLRFGGGYVAQGGDIGAFLAQVMCGVYEGRRAFHCEGWPLLDLLVGGEMDHADEGMGV